MKRLAIAAAGWALGCSHAAREAPAPPPAVAEIRAVEAELGLEPTENFGAVSSSKSYELCYSTGRFELPADYTGLDMRRMSAEACRALGGRRDVFFYAPEALAGVAAPVTAALEQASETRRDFVIVHEDFHDQPGVRALPVDFREALSTLGGLAAAAETARRRGAQARDETRLYLAKARLIDQYYARLRALFATQLSRPATLAQKTKLYAALRRECRAFEPRPRAFNACPGAFNNAGLAFDATYTRRYPLLFALYQRVGGIAALTARVQGAFAAAQGSVEAAVSELRAQAGLAQNSGGARRPKYSATASAGGGSDQAPRSSR